MNNTFPSSLSKRGSIIFWIVISFLLMHAICLTIVTTTNTWVPSIILIQFLKHDQYQMTISYFIRNPPKLCVTWF